MRITIAKKLWLSFIILIFILGMSGAISYLQIRKLNSTLTRFLSAQEPLENALLEMEVNIGEAAISVLGFVRDGNQVHVENLRRFQKRFETFLTRFNALAMTGPEKSFGREAVNFFRKNEGLSKDIITLVTERKRAQKRFTDLVERLNILIDESISTTIDENTGTLSAPKTAAMRMQISFHHMFSAIERYVIQQKPNLKAQISKARKAYLKWKAVYARSGLSPSAEASLDEINRKSETTFVSGAKMIRITDRLRQTIEEFENGLLRIRRSLNEKVQPRIRQETEKMAETAIRHGEVALSVTIGMTLFVLAAIGAATWFTTRGIIQSVRQLKEGSDTFGRGDLDHRIEPRTNDELKDVAEAFNQMAEKRKAAERKVRESAEKIKIFSYSVSHDLKSPAIGIHGLAILLQKQSQQLLDEKGKRTCDQIVKTSALIEELVNHINTFISTREAPITFKTFPMGEVMEIIKDEVSERLEAAGIKWSQPDHLPDIRADRLSIIRVIRNLVDNAMKYGGPELSRIAFNYQENETHHIFSVADDGVGLGKEDLEGIFEVFKRKKSAQGTQGTGLGLAIVKEILTRHGGDVWVEPGTERGVTFFLSISKTL